MLDTAVDEYYISLWKLPKNAVESRQYMYEAQWTTMFSKCKLHISMHFQFSNEI